MIAVYSPPTSSSAGTWCRRAFVQHGLRFESLSTERAAFVRLFGPEAGLTAVRLAPGQGRLISASWTEPGVIYQKSAGRAVLLTIELKTSTKPKFLTVEAKFGKKGRILNVEQTTDCDFMYTNLAKPIRPDRTARIFVQHGAQVMVSSWDGWLRKCGNFAVQECRRVGAKQWTAGTKARE